jgi:hypothetical protein
VDSTAGKTPPENPALATPPVDEESWFYKTPGEALVAVQEGFNYWSGKLTDSSYSLSIAVIGANWAVFGSVDKILHNHWAQWSLAVVILGLGVNLVGMKLLSDAHRKRMDWGEQHRSEWIKDFNDTKGDRKEWPFTKGILRWARFFRECRTWLPLIGGMCFLVALFTTI